MPRKVDIITYLDPCFTQPYSSYPHQKTKTWCPGPGAWFDAMDVDRTGDLDLDEAWPTLSHQLGFSLAQIAGAWSFGPGLSVLTRNGG